ncbi:MAG: amidohydrolase [Chloracidobacterium sp.]|nr:amidohydrolase [Chloracidobacterium sp.]
MRAAAIIVFLAAAAAAQQRADLIITNANVRTLDQRRPRAQAIAVSGDRITAVGDAAVLKTLAGPKTRVLDAGGRLVIPGFNDAHVHLTAIGNLFSHMDLSDMTGAEISAAVARCARLIPKGRWILGRGWTDAKGLPTAADLDAAAGEHPVLLYSKDYSFGLANSQALRDSRITAPNGVISGAELEKVRSRVPADYASNWAEIIETAGNYAASLGVTSVQDVHSDDLFDVLTRLNQAGRLNVRVYDCIGISDRQKLIKAGVRAAGGSPMARRGCLKGMADGEDGEIAELGEAVTEADRAGLQVMVHAIGPLSNANTLAAFERVIVANGTRDRRFRVEHAARMRTADIGRLARAGIIASMQPFLFYSGPRLGDEYRHILNARARVAFGSDSSMIDLDPLPGIHAAVNSGRRSISVNEAVTAYTLGSAYAEFQEREKGTIETGKLADIVILSEDIFMIDRSRIRDVTVVTTVMGGRIVYDSR